MTERREHFALDWIKREIDETLKAARQALESYATESVRDETKLRACLTYLHQVHGTLLMLELTGVTLLSDEMEQLAQALLSGTLDDVDGAQQLLMQGILQLPAFLEEIQKGLPDSRRAVLPLANEMRGARGEAPVDDPGTRGAVALHSVPTDATLQRFEEIDGVTKARRIRAAYQQVLLSVLKGENRRQALATLAKVAVGLERICDRTPFTLLWRAFSAYVAALADNEAELTGDVIRLLRRVDAEIKAIAQSGSAALTRPLSVDLVKQLVDAAREQGNTSPEIKQLAEAIEQEPADQRVGISKREAIHSAAAAIREELASVKDSLDLFVRSDQRTGEALLRLAVPLKQIGSTLSILGFESSRAVVADQVEAINTAAAAGDFDDVVLLGVASALLQVDENLAGIAHQRRELGGDSEASAIVGHAQIAVLSEARTGLEQVKQAVVDYVSAQWDASRLADVPALLVAVKGALAMVPLPVPAEQLGRCADYVRNELLAGHAPDWTMLDAFADAISGIDYHLERLCDNTSLPGGEILNLVERSLSQLGYGEKSERAPQPTRSRVDKAAPTPVVRLVEPVLIDDADDDIVDVDEVEEVEVEDVEEIEEVDEVEDIADAEDVVDTDDVIEADDIVEAEDIVETVDVIDADEIIEADDAVDTYGVVDTDDVADTDDHADVHQKPREDVHELPREIAARPAPATTAAATHEMPFELVIEDPDDVSSRAVSIDEVDDAFDLDNALFDQAAASAPQTRPTKPSPAREERAERVDQATVDTASVPVDTRVAAAGAAEHEPAWSRVKDDDQADIDEDILEIFIEEVTGVLESIDQWLPQWAADFGNAEALAEVRRAFHTLKGSGRIVGANVMGELAWSIENMLNRVLDGTFAASDQMVAVVHEGRDAIPALRDAFESRREVPESQVASVMERADVLASGGHLDELGEGSAAKDVAGSAVPAARIDEPSRESHLTTTADDAETFVLFEQEAAVHMKVLEQGLSGGDAASGEALNEEAVRALHTLRGSASMAGVDSVSRIAGPLYQVVREVRDRGVSIGSDIVGFVQQGVSTLRRALDALRHGKQPEDIVSFESESARIMEGLGDNRSTVSNLLLLDGAPVLLGAREFLAGWHSGAMDLSALSDTVAALHELRNEAESQSQRPITELCDALIEAYERFEDHPLTDEGYSAFSQGHERLLGMFDAIAVEQHLPDGAVEIRALAAVRVADVPEEELDLTEPEDRMPPSATVIDFPAFVRQGETKKAPAPIETLAPAQGSAASLQNERVEQRASTSLEPVPSVVEPRAPRPAQSVQRARVMLPPDTDREILDIFFEEADELLEAIDNSIHVWVAAPGNRLHLENLLRSLHTLKGGARLAGLMLLGDEAHEFESFLISIQTKATLPAGFFDALQVHHDDMAAVVAALKLAAADDADKGTVAEAPIAAPARVQPTTRPPAARQADAKPIATPGAAPRAPMAVDADADIDTAETLSPEKPSAETEPSKRTAATEPRELVRVSAVLLEQLVNLAGEASIIRSRVEQGMNDFSTSLEEMETTIERVREQLRRLEIETETQVLFRQENTQGKVYPEFDPLEMDRYSQLQQLSRSLAESASDMLVLKETLAFKAREGETLLLQQARVNTELQEGLMRTRMVPFSRLLPRLRRTVRQVARDLSKEAEFHVFNPEGELDRNVLERMVPPLEHMLRNAVDHGIEKPEVRRGYGKPPSGRIDLRLSREAGDVVIEIADDGAGIDVESVRAKAVERGLMTADARLRDDEILQFVLAPGFSTAKSVTQISGRGVGMDVVYSAVKQLGGSITIVSIPGKGTRFTVRLPFTVSVNRALMVSIGEDQYAVPLNTIEGIVRVSGTELEQLYQPDSGPFEYAGVSYRVRYLGSFVGRDYVALADRSSVPVVLVRSGDRAVAVHVDGVQGSREIVVKGLGPQFAGVGGISGATILGDGSVVVILDLVALIRAQTAPVITNGALAGEVDRPTCVMVVDDSVTVRKVASRLLERQGMDVMVAKDGVEAMAMLQERRPDIMLLDIEMPRMDGFEVARQIRHDERLAKLPIVMISSRTGSKHQQRAAELGVNRFLGKPFHENDLLATIEELVRSAGTRR